MNKILNAKLESNINRKILFNESMKKHTTFGIGGNVGALIYPSNKNELKFILVEAKKNHIPIFITGSGSNLLVSDSGFNGIVISLSKTFKNLIITDTYQIQAGAGVMLRRMVSQAIKKGIGELESLIGVPGTIGGALVMNAGAYGKEISNFFIDANVMDLDGNEKTYNKNDIQFDYRFSTFSKNQIITNINFQCKKGDPDLIKKLRIESSKKRKESQPLSYRSAGSIFKNPKDAPAAGYLIDNAGLKGLKSGDAEISTKHANFIINHGNAKSSDVIKLIKKIKTDILKKYNIKLKLEIKLLGFDEGIYESN